MFNTYHAKLQVFMSTRSLINWAIISITKFKYGREQLRKLRREGKWRHPIKTAKTIWIVFYEYDRNSNWTRPCMTRMCHLVVVLCRIATTVQTREKEFLSIILLPAALFYQVERDSCPHITRTSTQPAVLLFAPSISVMTVLPGFTMPEDPWNAIPSAWKKKMITIYFFVIVAL